MLQSRAPRHRSVAALLAEGQTGETAEDIIRRKCAALVARAKSEAGFSGPPFNPWHLASFLGFTVEETTEEFPGDGRLFPRDTQVIIQFRSGQLIERQRFTICHEIAHSCFPDAYHYVRHFNSPDSSDRQFQEFENLCNVGASELLFPGDEFARDLNLKPTRLAHAIELAGGYGASIEATLKRILDLTTHSCAAVFLTDEEFDGFRTLPGQMRIKYCWKSKAFRAFFPPGTPLPKNSRVSRKPPAHPIDLRTTKETWWINSAPRSFYVEAAELPPIANREYPKIVALVHSRLP